MNTNKMVQKTSKKQRKRLFTAIILLVAIILGAYTALVYHYEYDRYFAREKTTLIGYHKDVRNNLVRKAEWTDELTGLVQQKYFVQLRMAMANLINITWDSLNDLASDLDATGGTIDYYHLDQNLHQTACRAKAPLSLSDTELTQLIQEGRIAVSGRCYVSERYEGYSILACDINDEITSELNYDLTKLTYYIVWDNASETVLQSNIPQKNSEIEALSPSDFTEDVLDDSDDIWISRVCYKGEQYLTASSLMAANGNEVTVCTLKNDGEYRQKAIYSTLSALFLGILFACSCVFLLCRLHENRFPVENALQSQQTQHVRHRSVREVAASTLAFLLVSTLLFSVLSVLQISGEISISFNNLSLLEKDFTDNHDKILESAQKAGQEYLSSITEALNYRYDLDMDTWLKQMAEITEVDEITLFDQSGKIVGSTTPYKGYSLTTCETDIEYQLWKILNGSARQLIFYSEDGETIYLAARRTDDVGMILLVSSGNIFAPLLEMTEFADLFTLQNYADGSRFYYKEGQSDTVYLLESGSSIAKIVTDGLSLEDDQNNLIGMTRIDRKDYLYIHTGNTDWIFLFAYPVQEMIVSVLRFSAVTAITLLLIAVVLILSFKKDGTLLLQSADDKSDNKPDNSPDYNIERNKAFQLILSVLSVTATVILLLKSVICDDSLMLFQFIDCCEKGCNIISLTFIALSLTICVGFVLLIGFLNVLICKTLSTKGKTICTLISNIIRMILVVVFLIQSLEQLGVNAVAITTSLGLSGLALSIGSKDIISDLVAGLFIAFEGHLLLGDYVSINGFSGEIVSLGIRTIKFKNYNQEMIVNNTSVKDVINYSKGRCAFIIPVVFPFDTDIDRINQLIEYSQPRFQKVCNGKLDGKLRLLGVSSFKGYGVECKFLGLAASPYDSYSCSYNCNTELIKILNEEGIYPAIGI